MVTCIQGLETLVEAGLMVGSVVQNSVKEDKQLLQEKPPKTESEGEKNSAFSFSSTSQTQARVFHWPRSIQHLHWPHPILPLVTSSSSTSHWSHPTWHLSLVKLNLASPIGHIQSGISHWSNPTRSDRTRVRGEHSLKGDNRTKQG